MHKILVFLVSGVSFTAFSQDVITTKSGESIKTKIIEVTEETVSYKKYNDQQGATFVLKKDKIKTIEWENGDVDEYKDVALQQEIPPVKENDSLPYIDKKMGSFYLENGQVYDEEKLKNFLIEKNLTHIWTKYSSGKNLLIAGWGMIAGSVVFESIGMALLFGNLGNYGIIDALFIRLPIGFSFTIIGSALMYAGIPMAIVGTVRKCNAINDYNSIYAGRPRMQYSQNITLKVGCVGNGLGFSLHF